MISTAATRRFGIWLVGLFLIAQVFGVVSLLREHTAHVAATLLPTQVSAGIGNTPHQRHYDGDADGFIQHHELQDLSGTLTCLNGRGEMPFVCVANTDYVPAALAEGDPILLERPPKPMLSA